MINYISPGMRNYHCSQQNILYSVFFEENDDGEEEEAHIAP